MAGKSRWQFWLQNEVCCHWWWVIDLGFVTPWFVGRMAKITYLLDAPDRVQRLRYFRKPLYMDFVHETYA